MIVICDFFFLVTILPIEGSRLDFVLVSNMVNDTVWLSLFGDSMAGNYFICFYYSR